MPSEVADKELFLKLAEKADICRVMRLGDEVKLKLRTPSVLYTLKLDVESADSIIRGLKCKIVELTKEKKSKTKEEESTPREKQAQK